MAAAAVGGHVRSRTASFLLPILLLLQACSWLPFAQAMMGPDRMADLRRATVDMFYHGFNNYMHIAFPEDELRPVSCVPLTRDNLNPRNVELNDVLGNYSLTLIDSLSTLAILASAPPEDGDTGAKALRDFQDGVAALVEQRRPPRRGFDMDSKVQVFETVIRGVGGLLSAHLFAVGELPISGYVPPPAPAHPDERQTPIPWPNNFVYDGQLLRLALDLATRLLPAFYTPTGMPYPRVNLRHGIPFYVNSPLHGDSTGNDGSDGSARQRASGPVEITETCSAGAGSLVLEFTVLSRLTGDLRFEQLAKRAFWAVWYRRSDIGLIGAGVDAEQGGWIGAYSVIGAGADSFFEYALKTHILLSGHDLPNRTLAARPPAHHRVPVRIQDATTGAETALVWHDPNAIFPVLSDAENSPESFLNAWHLAHAAIKRHLYSDREHPHYVNVNLWTGSLAAQWIDSLGAYYSGLLTLAGELEEAIETNLLYTAVWAKYAALPERWSVRDRTVEGGLGWWPLRPEFIESVYHIYRATKDPWYLYVGEMVQRDITRRCWTECGWAGLQNVMSGEMSDRMESFFLGETAKYMYLLYDDRHPLNSLDAAYVFTTEGHPLIIPKRRRAPDSLKSENVRTNNAKKDKTATTNTTTETKKTKESKITNTEGTKEPEPTRSGIPGQPEPDTTDAGDLGWYDNDGFTNVCPLPPHPDLFTGSAVTARKNIYHAAKMLELHLMPAKGAEGNASTSASGRPKRHASSFFPWTLPEAMLPTNGTSSKVRQPTEMSLEFSAQPPEAAVAGQGNGNGIHGNLLSGANLLNRVAPDKIRVNSISGLKLIFRLEEENGERSWRVTRVNGVPLGRDEGLLLDRALVSHISDARFNLVRDPTIAKLHHLHHAVWMSSPQEGEPDGPVVVLLDDSSNADTEDGTDERETNDHSHGAPHHDNRDAIEEGQTADDQSCASTSGLTTLVKSFWRQIVSSLDGPAHATPVPGSSMGQRRHPLHHASFCNKSGGAGRRRSTGPPLNVVLNSTGVTPTGIGAASLPSIDIPAGAVLPASGPVSLDLLPWRSVYAGGQACDVPLPETAVRDHQVLVLRRGGCTFSDKLANIPSFAASPRRLQLVVVVSDDDDVRVGSSGPGGPLSPMTFHDDPQDFVRPLLDETQRTPSGLVRWQPLAMVMVGGGEEAYRQLAGARQFGLTRRYSVESQGVRIRNVIIDDGDEV
ncbi:er glucosyll hydrolase [Sporothrix schenckii 1099-18]|uniref:alpha-1,2-Mannosidase n=1 Tax=Sporothrix schenckii 1099-18 TaxID=1397361 RepID=A0A0F2LQN4_SPOSC|nr:er glucosyll hydrolase [Sporothrix schenckii 1099-18]KJR79837.1 er glucosyll hydrolase [Sporothrix schenckii 1099-18]